ncbi:condensin subunit ScpB [Microcella alkaliphila]|uniref:Condensin subunit ScpB n=1 Tax=Microcella alkaliphila TaxID=279828 RepID=A0A4Q7TUI2_9MICO|nr:SMC-Scp complex subunit ScpB [Microcella alkaliphila]RZT64413.1 condensin subunit ScpB [Microcella alkaliphila]
MASETVTDSAAAPDAAAPENADAPERAGLADGVDLARALEAIFMVVDEPQSVVGLASAVGRPVKEVRAAIASLVADYDGEPDPAALPDAPARPRRGFELREVGGGWRLYVRAEFDDVVRDFVHTQAPAKLSQAALETLAVIAYKQPISRGAVASIRAVNVDSVVRTLLSRGLITEAYTDSETGAIHYETTELLLTQLGINSLDELPQISPLLDDGQAGFDDVR